MKNTLIALFAGVGIGIVAALLYSSASRSEPATLEALPEPYYSVLWENDHIRVVEHRLEAGDSEPMHTHPPMWAYFLEDATVLVTEAAGGTEEATLVRGMSAERAEPWTHSIDNTGETPLHTIIVEFKSDPPAN